MAEDCKKKGCANGWIHHQHPLKPPGVILNSTPCPTCNADSSKPYTWPKGSFFSITAEESSGRGSN